MEPDVRKRQIMVWYTIGAVVGVLLLQYFWASYSQVETIPYSQFEQLLDQGKVAEVTVAADSVRGTLTEPLPSGKRAFFTVRVDPQLADKLAAHHVEVKGTPSGGLIETILSWILPAIVFYAIWMMLFRRVAEKQGLGGLMTVGKSRAKVYVENNTKVTFKDVAGVDEAKFELQEVVAFLRDPQSYGRLGARIPKGILLVGPPGTGKTLLARAVAGEASVPFFSISGSEFVEMFVGVGAARVRDLFEQARKAAPCIIFIDELDALGRSRVPARSAVSTRRSRRSTSCLPSSTVSIPAPASFCLRRPIGRKFSTRRCCGPAASIAKFWSIVPTAKGAWKSSAFMSRKVRLAPDVDLDGIAALTTGFTGADIANLVNEAAIIATRREGETVTFDDFTRAIERIVAGLEKKSRVLSQEERRGVAYHEMGHALVASSLPGVDPILKVSIIPRGVGALGYTIQRPTEDRFLLAESDLHNRIAVLMGGRAAEKLIFAGDVSTGAADDLQRATEIALEMVTRHGMDEKVGQRTYAPPPQAFLPGMAIDRIHAAETTAREIDVAVREIITTEFGRAMKILEARRTDLEKGVELLLVRETLTADDFPAIRAEIREVEQPAMSRSPKG